MANPTDVLPDAAPTLDTDIIIVGAGISGINTAYRLQQEAPKGTSYVILENRDSIGGTWDLFRYPGIRSDSDIHTFGFSWKPWTDKRPLAAGDKILAYMKEAAAEQGITKNIRFRHKVLSVDWSSQHLMWAVTVQTGDEIKTLHSRFIILGTGYYSYEKPLNTTIPGLENFKGEIIHPQFWPQNYDYSDKNMVIIGSGATAVTILPSVIEKVKRATMLQRSPTYIVPQPSNDWWTGFYQKVLPARLALRINRFRWISKSYFFYYFCHYFPNVARKAIRDLIVPQLPGSISADPHFKPAYKPWEQRMCASPDGDFYAALRTGKGEVVTDTIKQVAEHGIQLQSGKTLEADIIVTATGLQLRFGGDIKISVDGTLVDTPNKFSWKGAMLEDVPNLFYVFGYLNASWTLGADVVASLVTRLLHSMKRKNILAITPKLKPAERKEAPMKVELSSTYMTGFRSVFPKSGKGQWQYNWNYMVDMYGAKYGDITTGLDLASQRV